MTTISTHPTILAVGTAVPSSQFTQQEAFHLCGYTSERAHKIFLNSGIDTRCFYFESSPNRFEDSDQSNQRFLKGAMDTGVRAIGNCLANASMTPQDIDLLVVCTSTGYVCPDIGSRLIGQLGFRRDVQRASIVGLGCAGAIPSMQRACDFVRARPGRIALMLTVEICSACYFVDNTLETVVGNAICSDGAAAMVLGIGPSHKARYPEVVDFESYLDPNQLDKVGFDHQQGKLRIVLSNEIRNLAAPLLERALNSLLQRHSMSRSDVRFWITHPGGRRVIDNVQKGLCLTPGQTRFSREVLRTYGNMSSPTVLFVLDDVIQKGKPRPGDWGVMMALGPGMAAEVSLLKW
jgi:alkylresorcinol/alkylpyrone synthase/polyketide synthase Type III